MKKFYSALLVAMVVLTSCSKAPERYEILSEYCCRDTELTDFQEMQIRTFVDSLNPQKITPAEAVTKISSFMVDRGLINHSIIVYHMRKGYKNDLLYGRGIITEFTLYPDEIRELGGYYDTPYQSVISKKELEIDAFKKQISDLERKMVRLTSENQELKYWLEMAITHKKESKTDGVEEKASNDTEETSDDADEAAAYAIGYSTGAVVNQVMNQAMSYSY